MAKRRQAKALLIAVGGAVLLAGLTTLTLTTPQGPTPPSSASPSPGAAHGIQVNGLPWFQLTAIHPEQGSLAGFDLTVGTLGESTTLIDQRYGPLKPAAVYKGGLPFATGPVDGMILYGYWNGDVSELHALQVGTGIDRRLWSGPWILHDAALDPTGHWAYFLSVDQASRQPNAVFRVSRSGREPPESLADVPGQAVEEQAGSRGDLVLTSDGEFAAVLNCPVDCTLRWFQTATGRAAGVVEFSESFRIVGVSATTIWLAPECGDIPCPILVVNLQTGRVQEVGFVCTTAVVTANGGASVIVSDGAIDGSCVRNDYSLIRFDAGGDRPSEIAAFSNRVLALVENGANRGIEGPPGWVFLGPDGQLVASTPGRDFSSLFVRISDGLRVPSPDLDPTIGD